MANEVTNNKISNLAIYDYRIRSNSGLPEIRFFIKNHSDKIMKYIMISYIPKNQFGEIARNKHNKNLDILTHRITGPIEAHSKNYIPESCIISGADCNWIDYDNDKIVDIAVAKVEIEYIDGSKETILGKDVTFDSTGGCYVATAVYGSYNCPQVWTLRRYRDNYLAKTWYGRLFIHTYYAISPTVVRLFGNTSLFNRIWRKKLDSMVARLNEQGIEDTPYDDIPW